MDCINQTGPENKDRIEHLLNKELRHIEPSKLKKLSAIIDRAKAWGRLLGELTRPEPRLTTGNRRLITLNLSLEAVNLIEQQIYCGKSPTLALLNHWSITGRRRPTVQSLLDFLRICNLKWAEDFVCSSILGFQPIEQASTSSRNQVQANHSYDIDKEFEFDNLEDLVVDLNDECPRYSFRSIYETTNGFCHKPYNPKKQAGAKIGEGRFSSVYKAATQTEPPHSKEERRIVAAKLLKSECNKKRLINEIKLSKKVKHQNILELLGIALGESSHGGLNHICLVYEYMENGSLLDCLSHGVPTRNNESLTWDKRIDIAHKVARGIVYLHSFHEGPIIHLDIKTANILINHDLEPKVGDFTLVRQLETFHSTETQFSQNIMGTSVYMPPEAFRGDLSVKFDTFSFGIVLLELLTGLRPFDSEQGEDLLTHINERLSDIDDELTPGMAEKTSATLQEAKDKFLNEILDKKAGLWNLNLSRKLFELALRSTESNKRDRPKMISIVSPLETLSKQTNSETEFTIDQIS